MQDEGGAAPRYRQFISLMQEQLDEFKAHAEVIKEYGRDPKRNKFLERENTAAEEEYLQKLVH